jgi:hypothetical protein
VSRLWSRFGVRALSIALLLVAVFGGIYLGKDREAQQRGIDAAVATQADMADQQMIKDHVAEKMVATAQQRAAQREAAEKALAAAKAAAERAKRADEAAASRKAPERTGVGPTVPYTGPVPTSCNVYTGNRKTGCALLLQKGYPLSEMPCLDKLFKKESGWNHRARNRSSGAYGIPQALPGDKMASAGADWENNPATQIKWGLSYIKGRYGTPCAAWQHSVNTGWY